MKSAALGKPQAPILTAVPMFPRVRHTAQPAGVAGRKQDFQTDQFNSGGLYQDALSPHLLRPLPRRGGE